MAGTKIDSWGKSRAVIKGSSSALRSEKSDIISIRGGYKEVRTLRRDHNLPTSFFLEEPYRSSPPSSKLDGEWQAPEGTGLVYGIMAALFLWAVGLALIFWLHAV